MSKSIHTTIASARRNNTKAELGEPDNADIASLAKKLGYKKSTRLKRQGDTDAGAGPSSSKPGRTKA